MRTSCVALFFGLALVARVAAADITGNWEVDFNSDDGQIEGGFDCVFKQDVEQLTGTCSAGTAQLTGEVKGQTVSWRLAPANAPNTTTFTGALNGAGTAIDGRFTIAGKGGRFSALKQ
jgi:hypothetical protein